MVYVLFRMASRFAVSCMILSCTSRIEGVVAAFPLVAESSGVARYSPMRARVSSAESFPRASAATWEACMPSLARSLNSSLDTTGAGNSKAVRLMALIGSFFALTAAIICGKFDFPSDFCRFASCLRSFFSCASRRTPSSLSSYNAVRLRSSPLPVRVFPPKHHKSPQALSFQTGSRSHSQYTCVSSCAHRLTCRLSTWSHLITLHAYFTLDA